MTISHDRDKKEQPAPAPSPAEQTPTSNAAPGHAPVQPLTLPRGALVAMRRSGGLKFSSQEIYVYPDGRITHGERDLSTEPHARPGRKLNDAQIMRLRRLLSSSGFFGFKTEPRPQDPDAHVYELAGRIGSKSNQIELHTGAIPDRLAPLVEMLSQLLQ